MCWFLSVPGTRQYSLVSPCCRQGLLVTLFSPAIEVEASTRNRSERQREKLPAVLCSPFQTQLALHVIVSRFNRVQLLFVCPSGRQWSRSQALCRGWAASLPLITPGPALPRRCPVVLKITLPEKCFASGLSAPRETISTKANILLRYCDMFHCSHSISSGVTVTSPALSGPLFWCCVFGCMMGIACESGLAPFLKIYLSIFFRRENVGFCVACVVDVPWDLIQETAAVMSPCWTLTFTVPAFGFGSSLVGCSLTENHHHATAGVQKPHPSISPHYKDD